MGHRAARDRGGMAQSGIIGSCRGCYRSTLPDSDLCFTCTHTPAPDPAPEKTKALLWHRLLWAVGVGIMVTGIVQSNMETVILGNLTALWGTVFAKR